MRKQYKQRMIPFTLPPITQPTWIDTPSDLKKLALHLSEAHSLAVDTESNSLHAYREQVCLIQFSTDNADYLIDPFAVKELSALKRIFNDPHIEKVFHAAEYDLVCLKRDFGFVFQNIFDTMQSARILNYKQVGLEAIIKLKFNIQIDKRFQKADWAKRPLTAEQKTYAQMDTHYLLPLRELLRAELVAINRWELAQEEFARLANLTTSKRAETPAWQRIGNTKDLSNQQMAILQELSAWREITASRMDRPSFKVMDDKRLISIALANPASIKELKPLLSEHQINKYGNELLSVVSKAGKQKPAERPRTSRPSGAFLHRLDLLNQWRKKTADQLQIESDIILPRNWMHTIAENNPQSLEELSAIMTGSPWRLEKFGIEILRAISTKVKT